MVTEFKTNDCITNEESKVYSTEFFESQIIERKVDSVVDSYMQLINEDMPVEEYNNHKITLQKDFLNYINSNKIDVYNASAVDCIAKTAFSRLKNASENYYMSKLNSAKNEKLEKLKQQAEQMKKEYDLVKSLI